MHLECLVAFLVVCSLPPEVLDIGQPGGGRCKMLQIQFDSYCNWYTCIMLQLTCMTWYCYDECLSYHVMISCTWNVSWHPSQGCFDENGLCGSTCGSAPIDVRMSLLTLSSLFNCDWSRLFVPGETIVSTIYLRPSPLLQSSLRLPSSSVSETFLML